MLITALDAMQRWSDTARSASKIIGIVPTMGYLHDGHRSLIETAARECDAVVTTIFVNPLQFGAGEDYERYPRNLERDVAIARDAGTTIIFAPSPQAMYPDGYTTTIDVGPIAQRFEGTHRPGHFRGVATVVAKLFNLIKPHVAYFGQKDYQQTLVIARLISDLNFDITLRVLPTVRESDGLAMSSRNVYLSPTERTDATVLYRALQAALAAIARGERERLLLEAHMRSVIESVPTAQIDYVAAARAETLDQPDVFVPGENIVLLLAVRIGSTRLIDNALTTIPYDSSST
ncbi:MAG: pantothenate synthetase [Candidatus Kapaibacterium sp.]|nr:MAG: pantothenate synthetase [Candidatus Kapabacteria bacterium]